MADTVVVKVAQGSLKGKKVTGHNDVTYYSFQGIPYAKPPIGQLRFKPPQSAESWEGVRDALCLGPVCPQPNTFRTKLNEDEDCLFLNVYSPEISPTSSLPVMVWIHGGGLLWGSGNTDIYGPEYLVSQQIILVTLNYRLGVLGFLDVRGADSTANNGIRDQAFALKWVKDNIHNFGGDPNNVTIFGESAGGLSVHCHVLSPLSRGLFEKAIIMSGSMFGPLAPLEHNPEKAQRFAQRFGFNGKDSQDLVDFLRTIAVSDLVQPSSAVVDKIQYVGVVLEESVDAVLPELPLKLTQSGKFNKIPLMVGVTSAEGKLAYLLDPLSRIDYKTYNDKLESFLPQPLGLINGSQKSKEITQKVKSFYFNDKNISDQTLGEFIDLYGDLRINYGIHKLVREQPRVTNTPLYYYQFAYEGKYNFLTLRGKDTPGKGAGHGDELFYLFHSDIINNNHEPGSADDRVSYNMTKLCTNFAKTSNPSIGLEREWPSVTKDEKPYLRIDTELTVHNDLNKKRMQFWDDIYKDCGAV